jgi:formylglycine-generating enzyme required for sulfatase activity
MACYGTGVETLGSAQHIVDALFQVVAPACLYERPIPARHRLVFYIGHVEAFDRNLVASAVPDLPSASPDLDRLFAFGIDPDSTDLPSDMPEDWPELERVHDYCRRTRDVVRGFWNDVPEQLRHVALEHRLMHAETLSYLLHALCPSKKDRRSQRALGGGIDHAQSFNSARSDSVRVEGGPAALGQLNKDQFGWDNEFAPHTVHVDEFFIDVFKVTNAEYLQFMNHGGTPPPFWVHRGGEWRLRRMFDEIPLPPNWPVYATQHQAAAYAEWRGASLPTEAQWHRAAYPDERPFPWGSELPAARHGNFDFRRWDPEPVNAHPDSASPFGVQGLLGNGWEWTSSRFRPFAGFQPFPFYEGYSANFFDDDHFVLKGGSPVTDAVFLRRSFRNWFRADYPYVFATFRCIHNSR